MADAFDGLDANHDGRLLQLDVVKLARKFVPGACVYVYVCYSARGQKALERPSKAVCASVAGVRVLDVVGLARKCVPGACVHCVTAGMLWRCIFLLPACPRPQRLHAARPRPPFG